MTRRERNAVGRVYIVGAGPGDPELLTLKARRLIDEADVVYYDALVGTEVLDGVEGKCVFVGKRRGFHLFAQEDINRLMVESALAGERVVRLKGGDPFVFGRGGEEIIYLHEHGIDCEVVPGVSAAFAAAAAASLPLTHRGVSSSVAICAGSPAERVSIPDTDTKVFYMAGQSAREIVAAAVERGLPSDARVALIQNASLPDERVWMLEAGEIIERREPFPSPLVVIIGEVVEIGASIRADNRTGNEPKPSAATAVSGRR